ncbi:hypothetical protein CPLU01_11791 [Colletotrichum plurivorum]|uniref:Uncharacterized protein n=1 Tax=Colletotrichum plurivorum TaxID=2175906 RepID=A0A8H6K0S7_9PEZI|nr:hypothetical protein CPLU01_11791 [Colletotrichum plurivorum]
MNVPLSASGTPPESAASPKTPIEAEQLVKVGAVDDATKQRQTAGSDEANCPIPASRPGHEAIYDGEDMHYSTLALQSTAEVGAWDEPLSLELPPSRPDDQRKRGQATQLAVIVPVV